MNFVINFKTHIELFKKLSPVFLILRQQTILDKIKEIAKVFFGVDFRFKVAVYQVLPGFLVLGL